MKNLVFAAMAVVALCFTACGEDEGDESKGNDEKKVEFAAEDIAGKWVSGEMYFEFSTDKKGTQYDSEDAYDITWEVVDFLVNEYDESKGETVENSVSGLKVIDPDGYYTELQFKYEDDSIVALYDNDNRDTYKQKGESTLAVVENIKLEKGMRNGYALSYSKPDVEMLNGCLALLNLEDEATVEEAKSKILGGSTTPNTNYAYHSFDENLEAGDVITIWGIDIDDAILAKGTYTVTASDLE